MTVDLIRLLQKFVVMGLLLLTISGGSIAVTVGIDDYKHDHSRGGWEEGQSNEETVGQGSWSGWSGDEQWRIDVDGHGAEIYFSGSGKVGIQAGYYDPGGSFSTGAKEYTSSGWSGDSRSQGGDSNRGGGLRVYSDGTVRVGVEWCKHDKSASRWECWYGKQYTSNGWSSWSRGRQPNNDVDGYRARVYVQDLNDAPNSPNNPSPNNDKDPVGLNPSLSVDVSDPNGDSMDVTFYVDKDNDGNFETTRSDNGVNSGSRASISINSLNPGNTVDWYAVSSDGSESDQSKTFRFYTVNRPNSPQNPDPSAKSSVSDSQNLEVNVSHPDNLQMDVHFYLDKNRDGDIDQVLTDDNVESGQRASVSPALSDGVQYDWYAKARTDSFSTSRTSNEWSFSVNNEPAVDSIDVIGKSEGHAVDVEATVSDRDGGNQISSCELEVSDGSGNSERYSGTLENGDSWDEKKCRFNDISLDDASWRHQEELNFEVTVTDDPGFSSSSSTQSSLPNHQPVIESYNIIEYPDTNSFRVESVIRAVDGSGDEVRSCTIVVDALASSFSTGSLNQVNSTHYRCKADNVGEERFQGISSGSPIEITVKVTDVHGAIKELISTYTINPGFKYDYTSFILDAQSRRSVDYVLKNDVSSTSSYNLYLKGVNATFKSSGTDTRSLTLGGGESIIQQIVVNPVPGSSAEKLELVVENVDTGITKTSKMPVRVRQNPGVTEVPVPGIGILNLILLVLTASILYFYRI